VLKMLSLSHIDAIVLAVLRKAYQCGKYKISW
jgi:hypothetical protein